MKYSPLLVSLLVLVSEAKGGPPADTSAWVTTPRVQIGYEMERGDDTLRAELWVTTDRGRTWQRAAAPDTANPIIYDAPADGRYGFFVILHNSAGASSQPPHPAQPPQQWVHVDRVKPTVQLLALMPDTRFDLNREVHLRWMATDANLSDRPVSLHFRRAGGSEFQLIADAQSAQSSFRWTVPADVRGRIEVKITATDLAGNRGVYISNGLNIEGERAAAVRPAASSGEATLAIANSPPRPTLTGEEAAASRQTSDVPMPPASPLSEPDAGMSDSAAKDARARYDLGTWHRLRGDDSVAIDRYREALELDGKLLSARNDLAGLLLLGGDKAGAEQEYRRVLAADATHRSALKGLAFVEAAKRNYRSSGETLQKYLLLEPKDAEAWLHFGDVMMFTGDRGAARDAWDKAKQLEAPDASVRERADKRLLLYSAQRTRAAFQ